MATGADKGGLYKSGRLQEICVSRSSFSLSISVG